MSRTSRQKPDPLTDAHDFVLMNNGSVYSYRLDDKRLDAVETEACLLRTAAMLLELWHPDGWTVETASYANGYQHSESVIELEAIPIALGDKDGIDSVRKRQGRLRSSERADQPWAISRFSGEGEGWIRTALPKGARSPQQLTVWTSDGWRPIGGEVQSASALCGMSTIWWKPEAHSTECELTFNVDGLGLAALTLILSINLLDADLDPRPASAITAAGIPLADWRAAQQRMTRMVLDRLEQQGWSRRER